MFVEVRSKIWIGHLVWCVAACLGQPGEARAAGRSDFAGNVREVYKVNAQYRGAVTKGFDDLGEVVVLHRPRGGGDFDIELEANLRHPEKKKQYHFTAALGYRVDGRRVESVSDRNDFSQDAQKHREKIIQNAPFIYLMRHSPLPDRLPSDLDYSVAGKDYRVHYARARKHVEATVFDGRRWIGKFFILRGSGGQPPHDYEKFRVNTKGDTVISFVLDSRSDVAGGDKPAAPAP